MGLKRESNVELSGKFFWDALYCWVIGHRAGFFYAINGYRSFEPSPWDVNLWVEIIKRDLGM